MQRCGHPPGRRHVVGGHDESQGRERRRAIVNRGPDLSARLRNLQVRPPITHWWRDSRFSAACNFQVRAVLEDGGLRTLAEPLRY